MTTTTTPPQERYRGLGTATLLAFVYGTLVIAANVTLDRYGIVPFLGLDAVMVPAGVYFAALTFGVRDAIQEATGSPWAAIGAVVAGAAVSYAFAPSFAVASAAAFLLSELLDLAVYTPLRSRNWTVAAVASNVAGSIADSVLFLWIAFGWPAASDGWLDLSAAKAVATLPTLALVAAVRHRRQQQTTNRS